MILENTSQDFGDLVLASCEKIKNPELKFLLHNGAIVKGRIMAFNRHKDDNSVIGFVLNSSPCKEDWHVEYKREEIRINTNQIKSIEFMQTAQP